LLAELTDVMSDGVSQNLWILSVGIDNNPWGQYQPLIPTILVTKFMSLNDYTMTFNRLAPNDHYKGRTAPLTSKRYILYIYSTNIGTEYFKHVIYSLIFPLQNAVS